MMPLALFLVFLFSCRATSGNSAEHRLQSLLFKGYDSTSIPVKNASKTLMVNFDISLRSVQALNEKDQTLQASTWIRIIWKDELLKWDPRNYSGVHTVIVAREKVWKPEVVLYNSADPGDSNLLFDKMKTDIIIKHDGEISWFAPVILQAECSIDLEHFPFDTQKCPLTFGLWTVPLSNVPRINLSLVNNYGDISNYQKNGIFQLNGMPGKTELVYPPCCPGVQYTRIGYDILLQRRTVFYLVDYFMPTFILNALLFVSYSLPPECGERMTFTISLLLAFVLHMLHVASHIPPTSNAVPMVTKFLSASIAFSAVSMIISGIAVKWFLFKQKKSGNIPWVIRVVVNGYLARVFCLQRQSIETRRNLSRRLQYSGSVCKDSNQLNSNSQISNPDSKAPEVGDVVNRLVAHSDGHERSFMRSFRLITRTLEDKEIESDYEAVWRRAVCVLDRFSATCMLIASIITAIYLMFGNTKVYVK